MSELDRIEAMRAAGTISADEADRLIAVLRDLGAAPAAPGATDPPAAAGAPSGSSAKPHVERPAPQAPSARPAPPAPPTPPVPPIPPVPSGGGTDADRDAHRADRDARRAARDELRRVAREAREQARTAARSAGSDVADAVRIATDKVRESVEQMRASWVGPVEEANAAGGAEPARASAPQEPIVLGPEGTRWLRIDLPAGDLDVATGDVEAPTLVDDADGRVRLEQTSDGARLFTDAERGFLGRYTPVDAKVRVPRAWGVDLDVKAGDLEVRGVPYVRGRVLAGDLEVRGARGLDLTCLAGDVSVDVVPTEGRHRLVVRAGDVAVRLLPGTDATVDGRVSVGDASARGLQRERRGLGAVVHGRVGAGTAQLSIELGAGDLEVRADGREA